jgi:hypothetical protein
VSNDPLSAFFKWFEDLIKPMRKQIDILIANNPQAYVNFVEKFFDFLKASIETYKPIAVQNARNYAMLLREQKKICDSSLQYSNPFPFGSWNWVIYDINSRSYRK